MSELLDLGSGFTARLVAHDGKRVGLIVEGPCDERCHSTPPPADPQRCSGILYFTGFTDAGPDDPRWTVEQDEPLTISPSVQCHCGAQHGFIQSGRWVNAGGIVEEAK